MKSGLVALARAPKTGARKLQVVVKKIAFNSLQVRVLPPLLVIDCMNDVNHPFSSGNFVNRRLARDCHIKPTSMIDRVLVVIITTILKRTQLVGRDCGNGRYASSGGSFVVS